MTSGTSRGPEHESTSPGPPRPADQDPTDRADRADRVNRVRRGYLLVSGLDYFADMLLTVTSVLLLQSLGMGSGAVFALIAAVWIVEGVSEIPTGVLADLLGRRTSVAISFVLRAVGYSALFFSGSVYVAAAGVLLSALGGTFASGALEAWAVDETGAKDPRGLDRLFAQGKIAENAGLVLGTLTGAALGTLDLALPQIVAGLSCAVAAVLSLRLMPGRPDPDRPPAPGDAGGESAGRSNCRVSPSDTPGLRRVAGTQGPLAGGLTGFANSIRGHREAFAPRLRESFGEVMTGTRLTLRGDKVLIALIVAAALLWLFRGIPGVQWTVVYEGLVGGNLLVLGAMRSVGSLLEIPLLGWTLSLQKRRASARRTVIVTASTVGALALVCAAVVKEPAVSVVCYVCFSTAFGLCMPGVRAAMNERIESRHRATVLSVASLFNSVFTGGGLILTGLAVGDLGSAALAWPLAAAGFGAAGLWVAALAVRPGTAPPTAPPAGPTRPTTSTTGPQEVPTP
ncbi:MFS transporter [Streptomyces sp. NBC_00878]|uniref:MFS transporter n=1 Tax=Streptomyces sp. NBC_00878 TaxID=2975854 RepID=UPI002255341D|nr:MFS transporter [Streptomyces sp. NBC_00878]MCX4907256.1 MFS transporter [Streptomyces sp. NBC_00878]